MHILIVDDDDAVRKMLQRGLRLMGHSALVAENGLIALSYLEQRDFDLMMVDVFMPEMDGFELLRELRKRSIHIPSIALSGGGNGMNGDFFLKIANKLGVHCTLQKPFSLTEVGMAIDACALDAAGQEARAHKEAVRH